MAGGTVANPSADNNAPSYSPLSNSLWPQFPDTIAMNGNAASHLYRMACGVAGLVRLLNRSAQLRGVADDFDDTTDHPLSPFDEGNLWCALTALSVDLANLVEDLHQQAIGDDT